MTEDEPGSPPERPSGPARRSRRAGRSSESYDFQSRFGHLSGDERMEGLREPERTERTDRTVRGRGRLTVRELMEQMGMDDAAQAAPSRPDASSQPTAPVRRTPPRPAPGTDRPAGPRPADPQSGTPHSGTPRPPRAAEPGAGRPPIPQAPAVPDRPVRRPAPQQPPVAPPPAAQPPASGPPAEPDPGTDVTQMLPPVDDEPVVDLSAEATAERASRESRGQAPSTPPPAPRRRLPSLRRNDGDEPATAAAPDESAAPAPSSDEPVTELLRTADVPADGHGETPDVVAPDAPATEQSAAGTTPADRAAADRPAALRRPRRLQPTPDLSGAIPVQRPPAEPAGSTKETARRTATYTGRILVALACVLSLVGTGYVWNLKRGWNGSWNIVTALNGDDPNVRNKHAQYGDETYLLVGTDSRSGKNGQIGGGDADSIEGQRADTILLVNIPADRSRVVAVSWPRDLAVDRPECDEWDWSAGDNGSSTGTVLPEASGVKLNGVYAEGGPSCMVKTITQMSGLNINHFMAIDFEGFEKMVNVIGGVKVCSTVPLYDYELGYILRKAGSKKLTGKRALNYVRARHISAEGNGDYGRIKRQQLFLSSLLRSTLSSDVLSNPNKLNKMVTTFIDHSLVEGVNTDSLIELAESMQGMDAGRVTFLTIPTSGTTTDGENNEIPRTDDIDAIFNAIIDDQPLPGEAKEKAKSDSGDSDKGDGDKSAESSASPTTAAAPKTSSQFEGTAQYPTNMTVRVLNGSGGSGVATEVMNQLLSMDVNVPGVADASTNREDTVVRYGAGEQDSAATIAKMFPGARIQEDSTVKVGVEVILGSDYQGVAAMGPLPEAGSTITVGQLPKADSHSDLPNDLTVTNAGDTTCA
ncbi:LCP family protein [Gordonia sp. VNK21]|uniref:LCP family protein n=1 Tax=Gordonia sp. VNK21 TaxID=3382483 RepID=UPI0038D3A1BD